MPEGRTPSVLGAAEETARRRIGSSPRRLRAVFLVLPSRYGTRPCPQVVGDCPVAGACPAVGPVQSWVTGQSWAPLPAVTRATLRDLPRLYHGVVRPEAGAADQLDRTDNLVVSVGPDRSGTQGGAHKLIRTYNFVSVWFLRTLSNEVSVAVTQTGKLLRFHDVRGYGFIAPDDGGEDVFVHANDFHDDKYLFRPGTEVSFDVEDGERGLKASDVRLMDRAAAVAAFQSTPTAGKSQARDYDDGVCDLLSASEFRTELTEALLAAAPTLTAAQITQVRGRVLELAQNHKWIES